ncbi:Malectin-like domain, partial [Dillenia turbinata]
MAINPTPVVFLLSFLCAFSLSAATVFFSIDCGSSITSTDSYGIQWTGDGAYVQTGESKVAQNGPDNILSTLRVFTSHSRNCYNIPGEQGSKLLLRASFFYGNYDFKSAPPFFDLQFDGNEWITVQTSLDQVVTHEVTYIPKWKNI